jgi:hypothetical protein
MRQVGMVGFSLEHERFFADRPYGAEDPRVDNEALYSDQRIPQTIVALQASLPGGESWLDS